jgi:hypothetical protein
MKPILETVEYFHALRSQMRFGEFSRLPLRVHRFEIVEDAAECEWFMRPPDQWDIHLPPRIQQEHLTEQALRDGIKIRELIFRGFPEVQRAGLRMYREIEGTSPELMMMGEVERETSGLGSVASLVMRARLYGFRFSLTGGVLEKMNPHCELHASF